MWKHIPYSPGVYKIKNIKNKRCYIGACLHGDRNKNKKYTFEYKEV